MKLNPVIQLLSAQCDLLSNRVDAAHSLGIQGPIANSTQIPAAFVHPWNAEAVPHQDLIAVQRRTTAFGIIIVALNITQEAEQLEDVRAQILSVLLGYEFALEDGSGLNYAPCDYVQGSIIDIADEYIWWREIYSVVDWPRKAN